MNDDMLDRLIGSPLGGSISAQQMSRQQGKSYFQQALKERTEKAVENREREEIMKIYSITS